MQDLARIRLNGKDVDVLWKAPHVVDITESAVAGASRIEIEVTSIWLNRLAGDVGKPPEQRATWAGQGAAGL